MDLEDWEGEGGLSWTGLDCVRLDYIVSYRIVIVLCRIWGFWGGGWGLLICLLAYLLTYLLTCLVI